VALTRRSRRCSHFVRYERHLRGADDKPRTRTFDPTHRCCSVLSREKPRQRLHGLNPIIDQVREYQALTRGAQREMLTVALRPFRPFTMEWPTTMIVLLEGKVIAGLRPELGLSNRPGILHGVTNEWV
jgi:hypothetical protein